MPNDTNSASSEYFNANAAKYAASEVHKHGPSLPVLLEFAAPTLRDRALDVATGTGNTAHALAPFVREVVGLDLAGGMLAHARQRAQDDGQTNATFVQGSAEDLPFPDASFTLVTSRHAPHHFLHLDRFLAEAFRVLEGGGRLVIADQISVTPAVQVWMDGYQTARDPSHHAQRPVEAWRELAMAAGFVWAQDTLVPYRLDFEDWTARSSNTPEMVERLRTHADALNKTERQAAGLEYDAAGKLTAHHEQMMVVRLEKCW
ncbi:class I SAM-dependent methyltransferase [Deinococcus arenicola]|uniref:Methyltransferase domain-containing protein n=1 Tax=Deinococcus arenicola TaxID=2994950 RepID=A0ABU4DKP6_9DEIO|nr:methyltransferase domain-containing protein [Deinococcus sp. ZS9-10]MDV6372996.1 methyltransferase domain-containing protein [Deinococcus sp. ZS9-10]